VFNRHKTDIVAPEQPLPGRTCVLPRQTLAGSALGSRRESVSSR
jgi:hypothetical protein